MIKKNTRPYPLAERTAWKNFWRSFWHGKQPEIEEEFIDGEINSDLKRKLTIKINKIINDSNTTAIKIGKTGDALIRTDFTDYRGSYSVMKLIYRSENPINVSKLEKHYILKYTSSHRAKIDNIQKHSGGKMYSYDGYYFLYVVVR